MMKIFIPLLFLSIVVIILSCKSSNRHQVEYTIFLNPAQAFYSDKIYFEVKLNDSLILDTVMVNRRIDMSHLLKCFYSEASGKKVLYVNVNGKEKVVSLDSVNKECLGVFVWIDDHNMLINKSFEISRSQVQHGIKFDIRKITDSLRLSAKGHEYDSLSVVLKADKCDCNN